MNEAKISIELPAEVARRLTQAAREEFRDEAMHIAYMLDKLHRVTQREGLVSRPPIFATGGKEYRKTAASVARLETAVRSAESEWGVTRDKQDAADKKRAAKSVQLHEQMKLPDVDPKVAEFQVREGCKQFKALRAAVDLSTTGDGECFLTPKLATHYNKLYGGRIAKGHMSSHICSLVAKGALISHRVAGGQNTYEASPSGVAFVLGHMEKGNE